MICLDYETKITFNVSSGMLNVTPLTIEISSCLNLSANIVNLLADVGSLQSITVVTNVVGFRINENIFLYEDLCIRQRMMGNCVLFLRCMLFYAILPDDNDLKEFDYERYLMEEIKLRGIVDNPATSMVRTVLNCSWFSTGN